MPVSFSAYAATFPSCPNTLVALLLKMIDLIKKHPRINLYWIDRIRKEQVTILNADADPSEGISTDLPLSNLY